MKMFIPSLQRPILLLLLAALPIIFFSCDTNSDEEQIDCDAIMEELEDLEADVEEAYAEGDCDEFEEKSEELVDLYKKAAACEDFEDLLEDRGYDSDEADDFIDDFEEWREEAVDNCGEVDCDNILETEDALITEIENALDNSECQLLPGLIDEYIELMDNQGRHCEEMIQLVESQGYADIDEYIQEIEDARADIQDVCESSQNPGASSLNDEWRRSDGDIMFINGSTSSWVSYTPSTEEQAAISQGLMTTSTPYIKDIVQLEDKKWSCSRWGISYTSVSGTITNTGYIPNCTIIMSADGNAITISGTIPAGQGWPDNLVGTNFSTNWTRQ